MPRTATSDAGDEGDRAGRCGGGASERRRRAARRAIGERDEGGPAAPTRRRGRRSQRRDHHVELVGGEAGVPVGRPAGEAEVGQQVVAQVGRAPDVGAHVAAGRRRVGDRAAPARAGRARTPWRRPRRRRRGRPTTARSASRPSEARDPAGERPVVGRRRLGIGVATRARQGRGASCTVSESCHARPESGSGPVSGSAKSSMGSTGCRRRSTTPVAARARPHRDDLLSTLMTMRTRSIPHGARRCVTPSDRPRPRDLSVRVDDEQLDERPGVEPAWQTMAGPSRPVRTVSSPRRRRTEQRRQLDPLEVAEPEHDGR